MKKITIFLTLLLVFSMGMTAFAETPQTVKNPDGSYTTSGSDVSYANSQMTLLVVSGETITVDSIQYIDQVGADASGNYSFPNYLPKAEPTSETGNYDVRLGGQTLAAPIDAGTLGSVPSGVNVSGIVSSAGSRSATVTLTDKTNSQKVYSADTVGEGTDVKIYKFTIPNVPLGSYEVKVSKLSHLDYTKKTLNVTGESINNNYTLLAADVVKDNVVNILDITRMVSTFNTNITQTEPADIDCDGSVTIFDISYGITNFNKIATIED